MSDHIAGERLQRALLSLAGLSVGDALGERFFGPDYAVSQRLAARELPPAPWRYTDDTEMALSLVEELRDHGDVSPDRLARRFADRYDPRRGYGAAAHELLQALQQGAPWQPAARGLFGGKGSFGNGAAMRVAPLGAYFADDLELVIENAAASAIVTHTHPEGIAGAVAVALAAALAWGEGKPARDGAALLAAVVEQTPPGETRRGLEQARALPASTPVEEAARALGSGSRVSAQDTVPFAIWCAARHLGDFEQTFWTTVAGLGDRDTTCAIACGIAALAAGEVPAEWERRREPIPPALRRRDQGE